MNRAPLLLTASLLALAAAAPAAAPAAQAELAGAPTLRVLNDEVAGVQIAVDRKLPRRPGSTAVRVRISVAGRDVRRIEPSGRHGDDHLYAGSFVRSGLQVGRRYTVRIVLPGRKAVVRQVRLQPRRA